MKWTIQDRVVKVEPLREVQDYTYKMSEKSKREPAAEMVENEPFMYNKLVAGLDAKIWTDLNL